ncbi:OLC1v1002091C1 [Oldenlandia corymbosa var. corymbosa]|uniref:OLC1v1002091C1 n=1 Tax=Oldenlandia corymbosa var. corymbosa TaxID=529605 RepID=A0AAV1D710_OLDCO|nr:OLC1v1002091C1 [Oldenlandia corymbosa var. corymbosa]
MSQITEEIRASASELYRGNEICQEKSKFLLKEVGLPNGLLPMDDMEECGYVKDTGFVWLISKKKTEHKFKMISKLVQYSNEVTAYVEQNKIKKLTGVKAKELLMWVTISEIYVDEPSTGEIHFKTPAGLSRTFPVDAFVVDEPVKNNSDPVNKVEDAAAAAPAVEVKEV